MDGSSGLKIGEAELAREAEFARRVVQMVDEMTAVRERYTPFPRYFELQAFNFLIMRRQLGDLFALDKRYGAICEIGCGAGMHSALLSHFCDTLYGFDIPGEYHGYTPEGFSSSAAVAREVCGVLGVSNAAFADAYPTELPLADESVDLVFSWTVLEHVPDLPPAYREMRRVLRRGGYMIHVVPNTMSAIHTIASVNVDRVGDAPFITPLEHSEFLRRPDGAHNYNAQLNLYIAWSYLHPMMREGFVFERLAVVNDFNYALVLRRA